MLVMIRGIDHVVILIDELEAAIARYRTLGFTVTSGGVMGGHEGFGGGETGSTGA